MKPISLLLFALAFTFSCQKSKDQDAIHLKVAYNVYYDTLNDDYEIFTMNLDGTEKKNISNWKGVDWTYYAYRDRIYFISDRDTTHRMYFLYEMDAEGNNVRKISDLQLEDSWMSSRSNGTEMIVTGRIGKEIRNQLFLMDLKDGSYTQVTTDTAASYNDPLFSLDGKSIFFRHRKNRRNFRNEKAEIWRMNIDLSEMKQLTYYPEDDTTAEWHRYHAGPPKWNSAGNFISFQSFRKGRYNIFKVSPDGGLVSQITDNDMAFGWHDWSPDGAWLAADIFDPENGIFDIALLNSETNEVNKITDSWQFEQCPVFVQVSK